MRILVAAGVFIGTLSSAVAAGDLDPRYGHTQIYDGPASIQLYTWNGFYVGGHIGGSWNETGVSDANGFLGGLQAGFNVTAGRVVFGIEGQWTSSGENGDETSLVLSPGGVPGTFGANVEWIGTLTGRLGVAWDRSLVYVKGGAAWAGDSYVATTASLPGTTFRGEETRSGWVIGTGFEFAFRSQWSARVEYLYMDFGDQVVTLRGPAASLSIADVDQQVHVLTLSINYRFDWPPGPFWRSY